MSLAAAASQPGVYAGLYTRDDLRRAMASDQFSRLLDAQLPRPAHVLEIGCGAGRLVNFLGLSWGRRVTGVDRVTDRLGEAEAWRSRLAVGNAAFVAADASAMPFADACFDVVIAGGATDPAVGFSALARLVKPGGYLAARFEQRFRRRLFPARRAADGAASNRPALHAMLSQLAAAGLEFTAALPAIGDQETPADMPLFVPQPAAGKAACLATEVDLLFGGGYEGRCIVVGRRWN